MIVAIEKHHLDKKSVPDFTVLMAQKQHRKLHKNEVVDTPFSRLARKYYAIRNIKVSISNQLKAYAKEFGEDASASFNWEAIEQIKKNVCKERDVLLKDEIVKVKRIKGLGPAQLLMILGFAHPNRFSRVGRYLYYCGFKSAARKKCNYNHLIPSVMYVIVCNMLRCEKRWKCSTQYSALYHKVKQRLDDSGDKSAHFKAVNRVSTAILKEVYRIFKGAKVQSADTQQF
jgi:hypothetical protein